MRRKKGCCPNSSVMFSKDLSDWWIHNDIQYIDLMVKETQCFYFLFFMFFYAWCLSLFIMSRTTMSRTCCNFSQAVSCSKNALDLGFLAFEKPIEALPKPKRTKRTNLWRLETARNWNFWNFETWFSFEHFGCWALMNQEFLLPKYANHFGWGTWCNSQTAMTPWTFRDLVWMRFPRCLGVVLSVADGGFCVFGVRFGYPNRLPVDWFIG